MKEEPIFKAKIKRGTAIGHDHGFFRWPDCKGNGNGRAPDPDMEFDCNQFGSDDFELRAPGYGILGRSDQYGNGSIFVKGIDGLIISNRDRDSVLGRVVAEKKKKIEELERSIGALRAQISALTAGAGAQ